MPPPWNAFAVSPYGASTSSTNPRACSAREMDLMKPVKDGIRKYQALPVEAIGLLWLDNVPFGKFERRPRQEPSLTLSMQIRVCVSWTQIAPCIEDGVAL